MSDELKSSLGKLGGIGPFRYAAVHCRGHQHTDDAKVTSALGEEFRRMEESEIVAEFGMERGTVNPIGLASRVDVRQVFDRTVLQRYFAPQTMMTNLGDLTYGVEFDPTELVAALPTTIIADIVLDAHATLPRQHTIGILTGNAPESGMLLWQTINDRIRSRNSRAFRGDIAFPRVIVESIPEMGLSMELAVREKEVRPIVMTAIERLCINGATLVGVACNTTQYFAAEIEKICRRHGSVFVSLVDETVEQLHRDGITRFDFFGISAVTDFGGWSAFNRLNEEFDLVRPDARDIELITRTAFGVKQSGVDGRAVNRLRDLVNGASQTDTVVIALTELSAVMYTQKQRSTKRFVDTLSILGEKIADLYLEQRAIVEDDARSEDLSVPGSTAAGRPLRRGGKRGAARDAGGRDAT